MCVCVPRPSVCTHKKCGLPFNFTPFPVFGVYLEGLGMCVCVYIYSQLYGLGLFPIWYLMMRPFRIGGTPHFQTNTWKNQQSTKTNSPPLIAPISDNCSQLITKFGGDNGTTGTTMNPKSIKNTPMIINDIPHNFAKSWFHKQNHDIDQHVSVISTYIIHISHYFHGQNMSKSYKKMAWNEGFSQVNRGYPVPIIH